MPVKDARASWFSHKSETAKPYYYQVYLADHDINAELAPSDRAAAFRFTFPESETSGIVIDACDKGSYIKVIPEENAVVGYTTRNSSGVPENFRNWFVVKFDKDIEAYSLYDGKSVVMIHDGKSMVSSDEVEGNHAVAVVKFRTQRDEQVNVIAASSFISEAQAYTNLKEVEGKSFDAVKDGAKALWNNTLGYVPYNVGINENVARTLEYAYDDWCILQIARKIGRPEAELQKWASRAKNWRNVFDSGTNLMRGRNEDGIFQSPFSTYKWGDAFTEGNSWHYTWSVFHDVQGLIDEMGGEEEFCNMLDSVFVVPPVYDDSYYGARIHEITEMQVAHMGNYAHGNQPAQHVIYLYDYACQPWKAQHWAREVMDRLYSATPDGYCGDEDNGQTSAWYVFSALGFYSVCPASDEYAIGSPLFPKAEITLENGRKIVIDAKGNSPENRYIASMKINGRDWTHNYLKYGDLTSGARIVFNMSPDPDTSRGTSDEDKPYSFSTE